MAIERDYVLGTHDQEIERLGIQHSAWRPWMLSAWRRAGVTRGSRVLDVGAGPGFATVDLADIVGAGGRVIALERSARFAAAARRRAAERGLTNVRVEEADLMSEPLAPGRPDGIDGPDRIGGFDVAWCRWVASFVSSPRSLTAAIAGALRPGGVAVFHEYADYGSWQLLPPRQRFDRFVADVMASWRAAGGEPDVARLLPDCLRDSGLRIRHVRPLVFAIGPSDFVWQWPAAFLRVGLRRLQDLGRVTAADADALLHEFDEAERDPSTIMLTPMVLEIIAEK